jgi:hypothetical protein
MAWGIGWTLKRNEHPTSNIEQTNTQSGSRRTKPHWMFDVGCWLLVVSGFHRHAILQKRDN